MKRLTIIDFFFFCCFSAFDLLSEALTVCLLFRWYFAVISVSGVFAVTFSVIFAYVADITQEHERSTAYGLVKPFATKANCLNPSRQLV